MRPLRGPIGPLAVAVGLAALAMAAARRLDVVEVRGRSMAPTLLPGDRLLARRVDGDVRPGDVVLAPDPREPSRELVKRIAGVGPAGVRLRGDNPAFSTDARTFGAVPPDRVKWRVVARIWPLRRAGRLAAAPTPAFVDEGGEPACAVPENLVAG